MLTRRKIKIKWVQRKNFKKKRTRSFKISIRNKRTERRVIKNWREVYIRSEKSRRTLSEISSK